MLRMPAIPRSWLWAPAVMQALLVALLASESLYAWFRPSIASPLVIVLVCVEGLAGGSAYVSVFYHVRCAAATALPTLTLVHRSAQIRRRQRPRRPAALCWTRQTRSARSARDRSRSSASAVSA